VVRVASGDRLRDDNNNRGFWVALLAFVWVAAALWVEDQLPYMTNIEKTYFLNRSMMCLLVYGVFIAYYVWRSFKPEHWTLRDYDDYEYVSTLDLSEFWSVNMKRYKQMVMERRRRER
jgi:hypothetical protein